MAAVRKAVTSAEVAAAIVAGELDRSFGVIRKAMDARQSVLDAQMLAGLKPGDKVQLKGMRPKYVNGMIGTVQDVDGSEALVDVPELEGTRFKRVCWLSAKSLVPLAGNVVDVVPVTRKRRRRTSS